ncbi:MAG: hypothetical protein MZV64_34365 [Ignavibacteriales bacterium]|nr:hypothetical protein [Ignavibacteriales bacterium]
MELCQPAPPRRIRSTDRSPSRCAEGSFGEACEVLPRRRTSRRPEVPQRHLGQPPTRRWGRAARRATQGRGSGWGRAPPRRERAPAR